MPIPIFGTQKQQQGGSAAGLAMADTAPAAGRQKKKKSYTDQSHFGMRRVWLGKTEKTAVKASCFVACPRMAMSAVRSNVSEKTVICKRRVADYGEGLTPKRLVNAMLEPLKQQTKRTNGRIIFQEARKKNSRDEGFFRKGS